MSEPIRYSNGIRVHRTAAARARRAEVKSAIAEKEELMRRMREYATSPNTEKSTSYNRFGVPSMTLEALDKTAINQAWLMLRENRLDAKQYEELKKRFNI